MRRLAFIAAANAPPISARPASAAGRNHGRAGMLTVTTECHAPSAVWNTRNGAFVACMTPPNSWMRP